MKLDELDRIICEILQVDGKASLANIAEVTGIPASTANDRIKRLVDKQVIEGWQARLATKKVGAGLCCFLLLDMTHEHKDEAIDVLTHRLEVMEMHQISGAHSYLIKLRVKDLSAVNLFLESVVEPLSAVVKTETLFAMKSLKETSEILISE